MIVIRPPWEVRVYALNVLAASYGLPVKRSLVSTRAYRWYWLARLTSWCCTPPPVAGFVFYAEIRRAPVALFVIGGGRHPQLSIEMQDGDAPERADARTP